MPLRQVCSKFCYLKPVDVFYLLEVSESDLAGTQFNEKRLLSQLLEEIGALELRRIVYTPDLFSEELDIEDCEYQRRAW